MVWIITRSPGAAGGQGSCRERLATSSAQGLGSKSRTTRAAENELSLGFPFLPPVGSPMVYMLECAACPLISVPPHLVIELLSLSCSPPSQPPMLLGMSIQPQPTAGI